MNKCSECAQVLHDDLRDVRTGQVVDECFDCWKARHIHQPAIGRMVEVRSRQQIKEDNGNG